MLQRKSYLLKLLAYLHHYVTSLCATFDMAWCNQICVEIAVKSKPTASFDDVSRFWFGGILTMAVGPHHGPCVRNGLNAALDLVWWELFNAVLFCTPRFSGCLHRCGELIFVISEWWLGTLGHALNVFWCEICQYMGHTHRVLSLPFNVKFSFCNCHMNLNLPRHCFIFLTVVRNALVLMPLFSRNVGILLLSHTSDMIQYSIFLGVFVQFLPAPHTNVSCKLHSKGLWKLRCWKWTSYAFWEVYRHNN